MGVMSHFRKERKPVRVAAVQGCLGAFARLDRVDMRLMFGSGCFFDALWDASSDDSGSFVTLDFIEVECDRWCGSSSEVCASEPSLCSLCISEFHPSGPNEPVLRSCVVGALATTDAVAAHMPNGTSDSSMRLAIGLAISGCESRVSVHEKGKLGACLSDDERGIQESVQ